MENVGTGPLYSIVILGASILIPSVAVFEIVTIGFCLFSSVAFTVVEEASRVSWFHSMGFDFSGSTGIVSGSGELDPARPEVGGEFGFEVAGRVATRACSAEITTLGGISFGEKCVIRDCVLCRLQLLEETCISLERGTLGRSSTSWRRRSLEATFGVAMLMSLLAKTPPPMLLVCKILPYSETYKFPKLSKAI